MNLYTNGLTYAGTQADAKKLWGKDYKSIEVPTDKSGLINFLNNTFTAPVPTAHTMKQPSSISSVPKTNVLAFSTPYKNIKEAAKEASFKDLGVALVVLLDRLEEAAERVEDVR